MSVEGARSPQARKLVVWHNLEHEGAELQGAEFTFGESYQIRGEILSVRGSYYLEYSVHWKSSLERLDLRLRMLREEGASMLYVTRRKRVATIERDGEQKKLEPDFEIVDIEATPSTNTIPVRWLFASGLRERTFVALLVRLPSLECSFARQHYTMLGEGRFEYSSLDSGFKSFLKTDQDGVVLEYGKVWKAI